MPFKRGITKWGAQIKGAPISLSNMTMKLNDSFMHRNDLFVTVQAELYILRTSAWDRASSHDEVTELATSTLQLLNGCIGLTDITPPLSVGGIYEFRKDGVWQNVTVTGEPTARVSKREEDWISASEFKDILNKCQKHRHLADAVSAFSLAEDWFHVYLSLEALEIAAGGQNKLLEKNLVDAGSLKRLKRTANSFRHAPGRFEPVASPMPFEQARRVLAELVRKALEEVTI